MKKITTLIMLLNFGLVQSQIIDNNKGIDQRLDYKSLKDFGPWDDRNYDLVLEDITWLSENESELKVMVPAFYRIMYRKQFPNMRQTGKIQYPRSLWNYFKLRYAGFLIDGKIYDAVKWDQQRKHYQVIEEQGTVPGDLIRNQVHTLNNDVLVTDGAETAIAVNPVNSNFVVAGVNGGFGGQEMHYSNNGGATWSSSSDLTGDECCDPTMDWKSDGSYVYSATLGGDEVWFYRSDDNGQTWDSLADITAGDNRREIFGIGVGFDDKEYLHVDKSPTSPFKDNIYLSWHRENIMQFAKSTDDGNTFSVQAFNSEPYGIGSDLVTNSLGHIFHFWPAYEDYEIRMNKSVNGGTSFSSSISVANTIGSFAFPIPSMDVREVFMYVSVDVDLSNSSFKDRIYVESPQKT